MAKADESLVSRMEACARTLHFTGERILQAVENLEGMEQFLPKKDATVLAMYRLHCRSLRHEVEYLGKLAAKQ